MVHGHAAEARSGSRALHWRSGRGVDATIAMGEKRLFYWQIQRGMRRGFSVLRAAAIDEIDGVESQH